MIVGFYRMNLACDTENCTAAAEFTANSLSVAMWAGRTTHDIGCRKQASEAGWSLIEDKYAYCPNCTKARSHKESRLCSTESFKPTEDHYSVREDHLPEVLVSCTCGRTKRYVAGEAQKYVFICNGVVILKYHKDSVPPQSFFQIEPS